METDRDFVRSFRKIHGRTARKGRAVWASVLLAVFPVALTSVKAAPPDRQVVITIDDLPRGGDGGATDFSSVRSMAGRLLQPFRAGHIPLTGFVNSGRAKVPPAQLRQVLDQWLDAGAELGNHTATHPDINEVSLETYEADVLAGEPAVREALAARGQKLKCFRHPYLHTGGTPELKRGLQQFLDDHGYTVAPVTLDDADYAFALAYTDPAQRERVRREYLPYMESVVAFFERRSVVVFGREIPQILLIHANALNAEQMPALLAMFRRRGYRFVTLATALADPAYRSEEQYVGRNGISWIHRWSETRGMAPDWGVDEPEWVMKAFAAK